MKILGFIYVIVTLTCLLGVCNGANILFYFGFGSYSHRLSGWPLAEKLAERGHNVTFLSSFSNKNRDNSSKVHEFEPEGSQDFIESSLSGLNVVNIRTKWEHPFVWDIIPFQGMGVCDILLKDKASLEWIKSSSFDLVVIDSLHNDCGIGLAYVFGAKHVILGTTSLYMWHADSYGFPAETSWIPDMQYHYPQQMSLLQKMSTTIRAVRWHLYREWYILPHIDKLFKNALNVPNMPNIRELEKEVSLVLINTHFSEEYARSLPPLVVSVGGMHCKESTTALPQVCHSL